MRCTVLYTLNPCLNFKDSSYVLFRFGGFEALNYRQMIGPKWNPGGRAPGSLGVLGINHGQMSIF